MLKLTHRIESWPIAGSFRIARGAKTTADVIVARLSDATHAGRGECVPYARYGESLENVATALDAVAPLLRKGATHADLPNLMNPGAARNAVDCAWWDLEAIRRQTTVAHLIKASQDVHEFRAVESTLHATAYTISLDSPVAMATAATRHAHMPLLKIKLGSAEGAKADITCLQHVRTAAPDARLIVDANEAWQPNDLRDLFAAAHACKVECIEQPLHASDDAMLASIDRPVCVCADESAHTSTDVHTLTDRYDAVNIKLDKTGGLTEALRMAEAARANGMQIMIGCMVATSLAMAPALELIDAATWIDLDGPLLLEKDRTPGLSYIDGLIQPKPAGLWG